jgi:hypothetical protein
VIFVSPVCTLTITDDWHAEYEDSLYYRRESGNHCSGHLGRDTLARDTIKVLNRLAAKYQKCSGDELTILGRHLYAVAFGDPQLRNAFENTFRVWKSTAGSDRLRLRLVINRDAEVVGKYPWEFLYMPRGEGGFFLAGEETQLILTRYVPPSGRLPASPQGDATKLGILIVLSQPRSAGLTQVSADELIRDLLWLKSEHVDVVEYRSPTREGLRRKLQEHTPQIIHFIGHGKPGAIALHKSPDELADARAELVAAGGDPDDVDEADWADERSICALLREGLNPGTSSERLVFLHACNGATPGAALDTFRSVARDIAGQERIAAVVAMQYEISNTDAQLFARAFYARIREGDAVDEAVTYARRELGLAPGRQAWNDRSFGTPIIYLRNETPLVAGLAQEPGRRQEPLVKELCPNPTCVGRVIRDRSPCRLCRKPFEPCPREGCGGLVMALPGAQCSECDYEQPGASEPEAEVVVGRGRFESRSGFETSPIVGVRRLERGAERLIGGDIGGPHVSRSSGL